MSYHNLVTAFSGKKSVLLLTVVTLSLTSMAASHANFSGEWKLNPSKTVDANFYCVYDRSDRFWSKIMKITQDVQYLTIDVANSFPEGVYPGKEKLTFDGKETEVTYGMIPYSVDSRRKKFTVNRSADGETMTINSVVYMPMQGEKIQVYITEVWKLINGGKSISVDYDVKSTLTGVRHEKRVYDKV